MVYGRLPANFVHYPKMRFVGTIHGDEGPTEFEGQREPKK
jgi:hypothetical protein